MAKTDVLGGVALVVLWSSGFVGAELGTRAAGPETLLAWRYVVAAGVLVLVAALRGARPTLRALWQHGAIGVLCQFLYLGGVVTGVALGVPAGTAALIAAAQPLVVAVGAGRLLDEHPGRRQCVGLAIGLVGVALVVAGDIRPGGAPGWAYLLPVGGTLALSAGTLLDRRWRPAGSALDALTVQTVVTAALFVGTATVAGRLRPPDDPRFWWAVAWVVVLSSFGGYGVYLLVLRRSGATRASTVLYLTPPTTMVWAFLMFGDAPGPLALPGSAVCAVGVYLAVRRPAPRIVGPPAHDGSHDGARGFLPRHP